MTKGEQILTAGGTLLLATALNMYFETPLLGLTLIGVVALVAGLLPGLLRYLDGRPPK